MSGANLDLTAYALDQLDEIERDEIARKLREAGGDASKIVQQTRRLADKVREVIAADNPPASAGLRQTLIHRMGEAGDEAVRPTPAVKPQSFWRRHAAELVAASLLLLLLAAFLLPQIQSARDSARRAQLTNQMHQLAMKTHPDRDDDGDDRRGETLHLRYQNSLGSGDADQLAWYAKGLQLDEPIAETTESPPVTDPSSDHGKKMSGAQARMKTAAPSAAARASAQPNFTGPNSAAGGYRGWPADPNSYSPAQSSTEASASSHVANDLSAAQASGGASAGAGAIGGGTKYWERSAGGKQDGQSGTASAPMTSSHAVGSGPSGEGWRYRVPVSGQQAGARQASGSGKRQGQGQGERPELDLLAEARYGANPGGKNYAGEAPPGNTVQAPNFARFGGAGFGGGNAGMPGGMIPGANADSGVAFDYTAEQYALIVENAFIPVQGLDALSTFSIDVDTASYANVRRFLTQGQLPPANAVRIEELVNYFSYDYPQPKAGEPFSVNMEVAECPWQQKHLLLRVGLKGREIHRKERPVSNLVFLLDVSGSMADENKLPLLKQVLSMMVRELREDDRVSIVTYAGEAGLRLPPTTGDQQAKILAAIDSLASGGSTNGSAGIELAYDQAQAYFRKEGTNRVILATDGDLNVGITDDESLVKLIKAKAAGGTFLTVLGFGEGNLKDAKMERLADNGNGLYAYIDSVREGRKVLVEQMSGSLVTIAKDVKIQIEFNPQEVQSYRLLGYENRILTAPEFNDDKRDAGEIGAGHSVTALYELVPTGLPQSPGTPPGVADPLKYQSNRISGVAGDIPPAGSLALSEAAKSGELLTLKLRHKEPDGEVSKFSQYPLKNRGGKFNAASKDFQFAAAVASFGMQLRNSQYRGDGNLAATAEIAAGAIGEDQGGYRAEFVDLVRKAQALGVK